ncbi:MAG: response regulator transcription factor [Acidimicrobiales bacterium]
MLRVLIADDQEMVRAGLRMILEAQPDIEVVGEAADGAEAIALATRLQPDVCLMDIRMPGTDGITATRALAGPEAAEPLAVVIITTFDLDEYVYGAIQAGAKGFLLKDASASFVIDAVRAAASGDALISPAITTRLLEHFTDPQHPTQLADPIDPLTGREEEVLRALARGLTNAEIGEELNVSLSTVKSHINTILTKLNARNRVELAIWAHQSGRMT